MGEEYDIVDQYGRRTGLKARRSGGGSGCFDNLFVIILVIAIPIACGVFAWGKIQTFIKYRTFDDNAAATYAVATVQAPVLASQDYYTNLAMAAQVSLDPVTQFNYNNVPDGHSSVYFHLTFHNNNTAQHSLHVLLTFTVREIVSFAPYPSTDKRIPVEIQDDYDLPAQQTTVQKVVWEGQTSATYSAVQNFHAAILTIDGLPSVDPRTVLSYLQVKAVLVNPPLTQVVGSTVLQCQINLSNTDSLAHHAQFEIDYKYSYLDTGDTKEGDGTFNSSIYFSGIIPAKTTVYNFEADTPIDQKVPIQLAVPNDALSVTVTQLILTLADPGDNQVPQSILSKSLTITGCNYKKH